MGVQQPGRQPVGHLSQHDASKAGVDKVIGRRRLVFREHLPDIAAGKGGRNGLPETITIAAECVEEKTAMERMPYLVGLESIVVPCPAGGLEIISYRTEGYACVILVGDISVEEERGSFGKQQRHCSMLEMRCSDAAVMKYCRLLAM